MLISIIVKLKRIFKLHNKNNPLLIGEVRNDAKITIRDMKSIKGNKIGIEQIGFLMVFKIIMD